MQLTVQKLKADNLNILNEVFNHDDTPSFTEMLALQIAKGKTDIFILYKAHEPIGELRVQYDSGNNVETIDWKRVYLYAFKIINKYRNRGCGSYLIANVIEQCKQRGYTEFTIGVEKNNHTAKHVYKKLGFDEVLAKKTSVDCDILCEYELLLKTPENNNS